MSRAPNPTPPNPSPIDDRLLALLADRATEGLTPEQDAELRRLLESEGALDADSIDRAATALALAFQSGQRAESLPAPVREKVERHGRAWIAQCAPARAPVAAASSASPEIIATIRRPSRIPWLIAAAALTLAAIAWLRPLAPAYPNFEQVAASPDAILVRWAPGPHAIDGVTGEVLWSDDKQAGYMVFRNLPPLDPAKNDYQLWIFDPERDENPVDGGVFNIRPGQTEVRVPIRAKVRVDDPTLFAITVEQPGGVVVSKRERLPLVAPVQKG